MAESIGRQVGAWPTILAGGFTSAKDPRMDHLVLAFRRPLSLEEVRVLWSLAGGAR